MDNQEIKILLVEDDPGSLALFKAYLKSLPALRHELASVDSVAGALKFLRNKEADVVILDLSLPDSHGLDTIIKIQEKAPRVPLVVLTGSDSEALALAAMRHGVQDYLVKGSIDPRILHHTIRHAIERKRVEESLRESERRYRHLLESITDYIYTVTIADGEAVRTVHGPGCEAVTGYKPSDFTDDPFLWFNMIHEEDRPFVIAHTDKVLVGENTLPVEHRIHRKNGSIRWVKNTSVPRKNEAGQVIAYDGLIQDITERRQAEEQLRNSEALYHSLVETLPQFMFRKDKQERFTFVNQRFCATLGKRADEILGKNDFDFFPPDLARKYQADDRMVMRTRTVFETVEEYHKPSGEKFYMQVVKTPTYDARGNLTGIQGIFWDITEKRRNEEALQKAWEDLNKSHEELKAAQLQLIQAEKMDSVGTLAAGIAHEVKNPLQILLMGIRYLSSQLENTENENVQMALADMRNAVSRADVIIKGLLEFSSAQELNLGETGLNDIVEQSLRLLNYQIVASQVTLNKQLTPGLPNLKLDRLKVEQAFINLVMNAVHAMPDGGALTIRTGIKPFPEMHPQMLERAGLSWKPGDLVVAAEIEDTGPGIPAEKLTKIFDPFFTTKPVGAGTGLGLTVVKKIIEMNGGFIEVGNVPDGGVRAVMYFKP